MAKIAIIGAGQVGATAAYTLAISGLAEELAVVDLNEALAQGAVADIAHGMPFCAPVKLECGGYDAARDADLVVMTAGAAQRPGETRRELVGRNLRVMESAGREIARVAPKSVLVIVSNPLDALTETAFETTGFPKERVFGSGTVLDTARLKSMLSVYTGVDARSIDAYVLGEHGDSEFAAWSLTRIAGMTIEESCGSALFETVRQRFDREVRNAAYAVIEQKGCTCYAIAQAIQRICEAVLRNEHSVLTVSIMPDGLYGLHNVALSLPCVVGRRGIERILEVSLSAEERMHLHRSADAIRAILPEKPFAR